MLMDDVYLLSHNSFAPQRLTGGVVRDACSLYRADCYGSYINIDVYEFISKTGLL